MFFDWVLKLPWPIINTLISFCELLVICIPASAAYMYYRVSNISVWPIETTEFGATILLHNKTNKTIFVSSFDIVQTNNSKFEELPKINKKNIDTMKPDEYTKITISYKKESNDKQTFKLNVTYNHNKKKKIKVTV